MELANINLEDYNASSWIVSRTSDHISPSKKAIEIWDIMIQIVNGVQFIHQNKEVHRDLKPRNSIF
jgi:serine/threonine protein kinase